jgi:hypothetical protein
VVTVPDGQRLNDSEMRTDLRASVAARRELPPEFEDQVLEAFLARIESRVDQQIAERATSARPARESARSERVQVEVIAGSFGLSIPLMAIAGDIAQGPGVFAVVFGLVAVNLLYFIDRWVRMN